MKRGGILVCLDGSPLAEEGIDYAEAIARATGSELLLLEVLELVPRPHPRPVDSLALELDRANAGCYLRALEERVRSHQLRVRSETLEGVPAEKILAVAEREEISLSLSARTVAIRPNVFALAVPLTKLCTTHINRCLWSAAGRR